MTFKSGLGFGLTAGGCDGMVVGEEESLARYEEWREATRVFIARFDRLAAGLSVGETEVMAAAAEMDRKRRSFDAAWKATSVGVTDQV